jgi:hypothetical protein
VSGRFNLVDKSLGKVCSRNIGNPILVSEQNIAAKAEVPGMGSGIVRTEVTCGRNKEPLKIITARAQIFEDCGKLAGLGTEFLREVRERSKGASPLFNTQRSGATDDPQANSSLLSEVRKLRVEEAKRAVQGTSRRKCTNDDIRTIDNTAEDILIK